MSADEREYRRLKDLREELQERIKSMVKECNGVIAQENTAAEGSYESARKGDQNKKERERVYKSVDQCNSVIKLYDDFVEINRKYIDEINGSYTAFWSAFEDKCETWTAEDIIIWFKYKTLYMDTSKVKWDTATQRLNERNITGKSLHKFSDLTFELLHILDDEVVKRLLSAIHGLTYQSDDDNTSKKTSAISKTMPPRFQCSITGGLMKDPVMAFDGHCYDRKAIEEYLEAHKKSPVTGKPADHMILISDERLKTEILAYTNSKRPADEIRDVD